MMKLKSMLPVRWHGGMVGKRLRFCALIAPVEQPNTGSDVF